MSNNRQRQFNCWIALFFMILMVIQGRSPGQPCLYGGDCAICFDEIAGRLIALIDRRTGFDFVETRGAGNFWAIDFLKPGIPRLLPEQAKIFQWSITTGDNKQIELLWKDFTDTHVPGLIVRARGRYDGVMHETLWEIEIENLTEPLQTLWFPRIPSITPMEDETLVIPYWMGEKTSHARQILSASPSHTSRREFLYPGILSLQCIAVYSEQGPGMYLRTEDTELHSKIVAVFSEYEQGLGIELGHIPESHTLRNGSYTPGYCVRWGVFHGDWWDVATIYRQWAVLQEWCKNSRLKFGEIAAWATDTGCWIWNRGPSDGVLGPAEILNDFLEAPVSVLWHWWHGCPYDAGFPEYLPPREGEQRFMDAVLTAREKGIYALVYMNQRLWSMSTKSWAEKGAATYAVKKQDGTIQPEIYNTFTQTPNASMCMGTSFWRNTYAELAHQVFNQLGVSGLYMDQACSSLVCYDTSHEHAPGGGQWWVKGFTKLASTIRQQCAGIVLAGEGCGEPWIPHLDLMLSLQVSRERYASPGEWEPIPFFQAVYHEYTLLFGNYASLTHPPYDPLWPKEFAPEKPMQLLDSKFKYQFRLEQARAFVWGQQPCIANFLPEHLTQREEELAYLKQLVHLRKAVLPYLLYGVLMRPPKLDVPTMEIDLSRLSIYAGQRDAVKEYRQRVPQYLMGLWRGSNGNLALTVANISDSNHPLDIILTRTEDTLPRSGHVYKNVYRSPRSLLTAFTEGTIHISDTLGPAQAVVYEIISDS